jgi:hypothetical protein
MPPVNFDVRSGGGARLLYPALVTLLTVFAIAPLTYPGSFQTHTGFNAFYNLMDLNAHLWAFGWAPTFGRGFDLLRGDGILPYASAEFFHLLGFSFGDSIKLVYAFGFLLSGVGMFALARRIFHSAAAGLLAAVVYVYFPYHLALVYVRGAFGEAVAWALFPFALWAMLDLFCRTRPALGDYVLSISAFALVVLAQPGLGLLFALAATSAFYILRSRQKHPPIERAVGIGTLLGFAVMLPALIQNAASVDSYAFISAFADPFQFFTASWGSALPRGNYLEQFPYQIGIAALGLTILALAMLSRSASAARRLAIFAVVGSAVALLLMMPLAAPLWDLTRATLLVEYPFELLVFVGLGLAVVGGSIVVSDTRLAQTPMLAALVAIPILAVYAYLAPDFLSFAPVHPPLAIFNDNEIALLDYTILRPPGTFRHGATVQVALEWQALRQVNHDYTVFVHAVDANGKQWGGEDTKPQNGALPTTNWSVGRVISDTHSVQIDLAGPPEGYHLEVGLYTALNGERAVTETGATEIRIDENQQ